MKHKVGQTVRKLQQRISMPLRFHVYAKALRSRRGLGKLRLVGRIIGHELKLVLRWWRVKDQHYTWRWRVANVALVALILLGAVLPIVEQLLLSSRYRLNADALQLVGASDPKLQAQLKYADGKYQFNQAALQQDAPMRTQAGASTGKGNDTSTYALSIPQDFAKGTTYTDVNTSQSFQLVPQFSGNPVKEVQGHLVIPVDGAQAIYTLKGNGLKEDVVVPKATQDSMSFSYTLQLPKTLQAKVIPDSGGSIGIYSADPTLYGNISASSSKDQAALQKARENGDKTNLVFGIPSPTIKTVSGKLPASTTARFELQGNTLSVIATGLTSIHGAFTIDPSVVVTSASDFQTGGSNEGMINFDATNNQITRGGLTGGSLSTTTGTSPTVASTGTETASTATDTSLGVPSGVASGSLVIAHVWSAWTTSTTPTSASITAPSGWTLSYGAAFQDTADGAWAYAGWYYKYATGADSGTYVFTANLVGGSSTLGITGVTARITGGPTSGNPFSDTLQTSNVTTSSPTISSFTPGANYTLLLAGHDSLAQGSGVSSWTPPSGWTLNAQSNGFVALETLRQDTTAATGNLTFASTGNADYNWASVAAIRGTTSGGWTATNSFTTARDNSATVAYNGYLYILGGYGGSTYRNDVQYAPINADGTVGTWKSTASFTTGRAGHSAVAYNGYLYILGGYGGSTYRNDVQYAPINADGTVGTWKSTASFTTGRNSFGTVVYNGYLYILGGNTNSTPFSDVQYAPINADGTVGTWNATTSLPSGRDSFGAVAYNGYVYILGGENSGYLNSVQYAPINADGTVGTWSTAPSFTTARFSLNALVYNGYLYILGGSNGTGLNDVQYAPINGNGSVGSWQTTTSFTTGRSNFSSAAYNGYLYITGGYGSTYLNDVQYASINPAGIIGSFTAATNLPSSYTVTNACSVVVNGYIYEIGGTHWGAASASVYYSAVSSGNTLGTWSTTTSLPVALYYEGCAVANGYIYVVGGYTGTAGVTTVYYAPVSSTGTIASWSSYTGTGAGSLPSSVYNAGVVISNNYLYVVGGSGSKTAAVNFAQIDPSGGLVTNLSSCPSSGTLSHATWCSTNQLPSGRIDTNAVVAGGYLYEIAGYSGGATATVYYAAINTDGTLGSWQTSVHALPTAVYWPSIVANKGTIYVIGGYTGSATVTNVYYATVGSNGDISAWQQAPPLPTGQYEATAVVYNDTIYDIAGYTVTAQYTVSAATINNGGNGAVGSWTSNSGGLPAGRTGAGSAVYNGYLYMVGGRTSGAETTILYAQLQSNGTLGSWQTATPHFTTGRYSTAAVAYNGYLYVLGGTTGSSVLNDTQYAPIKSNGDLGTWTSTSTLSVGVDNAGVAEYNGYIYLVGGETSSGSSSPTTQYAAINPDGTLGSWATTMAYPNSTVGSSSFAYGGYLYGVGGTVGSTITTAAYKATINSGGTIGSWTPTNSLSIPRRTALASVYNGFVYMAGGYTSSDDSTATNTVEYAPILANGALGSWGSTSSFAGTRHAPSGGVWNGFLYITGGSDGSNNGNTYYSDAQYAALTSIARTAEYSKTISFGTATNITSITYNGRVPGGNAAVTYQIAGADGIFGSTATTASASGSGGCVGNAAGAYYARIHVTLDDSSEGGGGAFPDGTGNASLSDFTINYNPIHPAPNIRLRLGQTLQSGNLSPFDTCLDANGGGGSGATVAIPNTSGDHTVVNGNTSGNPITLAKPANTTDSDLLICLLFDRNTATNSFPAISGWTQLSTGGTVGTAGGFAAYYMPVITAASLPSSWSVTLGGSRTMGIIFRVTGANLSNPIAAQGSNKAFNSDGPDTDLGSVSVPVNGAAIAVMGSFWSETADTTANNSVPGLSLMLTETNPASGTGRGTSGVYLTTTPGPTGTITPTGWLNGTLGTNGAVGRLFAINPD